MAYYIYKTCETCGGDGTVTITYPPGSVPCWNCNGIGAVAVFMLPVIDAVIAELQDDCNDIRDKSNDIKEKVDETKEVCEKILEIVEKL